MTAGLNALKHIICLMMENRSFDHMLGSLSAVDPRIDGLTGQETNTDTTGKKVKVEPKAAYQGQLDTDPDHHFPGTYKQLYYGTPGPPASPSMDGFIQSYFDQRGDVAHSRKIMYYFPQKKLPVLTTLALEFAVFNRWFASIPGPTPCNRVFAHYGTSYGNVGMKLTYTPHARESIYERLLAAGKTTKIYYYDQASSSSEILSLLIHHQPQIFATYDQFLGDCKAGQLPHYAYIEPNYNDHDGPTGAQIPASDQHPDHDVRAGERLIAFVYNAIQSNPQLWKTTLLLVLYDEHGGLYDHVPPPACTPDGYVANDQATEMPGVDFHFDRLGIRVPAILISPWITKNTVVPKQRIFEHASIPATITKWLLGAYQNQTPREAGAETFLDILSDTMRPLNNCPGFAW